MSRLLLLLLMAAANHNSHAREGLVVVANTHYRSPTLTLEQVRNLFMGGNAGLALKPVALPLNNHTRLLFNAHVMGLPEKRIQSYWAQMKFTGRRVPPAILHSEQDVVSYLLENPETVSYLPADQPLPDNLKVLYWAGN